MPSFYLTQAKSNVELSKTSHERDKETFNSPLKRNKLNTSSTNSRKIGVFNQAKMLNGLKEKKRVLLNYIVKLKKKEFPK